MNVWNDFISRPMLDARFAALFLDVLMKSFVVLMVAVGICVLWRRASAATRHWIWFLALASLPCLPLLTALLPTGQKTLWSVSTSYNSGNQISLGLEFVPGRNLGGSMPHSQALPSAEGKNASSVETAGSERPFTAHFAANWLAFALGIWGTGIAAVLISLGIGQLRLRGFRRRAQRLQGADWLALKAAAHETLRLRRTVVLLESADNAMPLTWGWWRPVVLLPVKAENWPMEQRRMVLLHELAHVKRRDCLTQLVAKVVCAFFWFNPLAWLAARQMCVERERACDDLVLNGGCKASDYAGLLVDIAGRFRQLPQGGAISMARPSGLGQRVESILDSRRNRSRMAKMTAAGMVVTICVLGLLIGGCQTVSLQKSWSLENSKVADQLKSFVADKQAQEATLIQAAEKDFAKYYPESDTALVQPDCRPFFAAAAAGNWPLVSNLWSELESHTLGLSKVTKGYPHGMWLQPVRETYGAVEALAGGSGKYAEIFGDEILQSIPPGSVYFGGTDPGRFIITALQKSQVAGDPFFTLTQNALADGTYLEYLRSMYAGKIYIPTGEDSQKCFETYVEDIKKRSEANQLKPGEHIKIEQGRVQISGATAVMQINGLLVKTIFDRTTNHDFFIEQSFPLDWMYPYLEPHGLIFKLNRQPLPELSGDILQRDHDYWTKTVQPMIGGWLNESTTVEDVIAFAKRVFIQHDLDGFTGDPEFVQNGYSCEMFSKERASIAGLYVWRMNHADEAAEKARMAREADFAFRQALALCPYSPEATQGYVDFLKSQDRAADARLVQDLGEQFKPQPASSSGPVAKVPFFQIRLVVDAAADDAEKMTNITTNLTTGKAYAEECFVKKTVLLDQSALSSARLTKGPQGDRQIEITLTDMGRKQFTKITREHLHQRLAIIIDGKLVEAPVIQSEIASGTCQIVGSFSEAEAKALASRINAAAGKW